MRNLRGKVPDASWPDVAIRARACYEAASPALATVLRNDFVQVYERDLPAAARCFLDDFEACTAHLQFPLRHRKVIRTTNLLERLFGEERRRTKVVSHAPTAPASPTPFAPSGFTGVGITVRSSSNEGRSPAFRTA
jgi:transposase-like protein